LQKSAEVIRDTTVVPGIYGHDGVPRNSRYSGHDRCARCICYYETRPFLLLAHKRPSLFLTNVNFHYMLSPVRLSSVVCLLSDTDFVVDS